MQELILLPSGIQGRGSASAKRSIKVKPVSFLQKFTIGLRLVISAFIGGGHGNQEDQERIILKSLGQCQLQHEISFPTTSY